MAAKAPEFSQVIDSLRHIRGLQLSPMVTLAMRSRLTEALKGVNSQGSYVDSSRIYRILPTGYGFQVVTTQADDMLPGHRKELTFGVFNPDQTLTREPFGCATLAGRDGLVDEAFERVVNALGGRVIQS